MNVSAWSIRNPIAAVMLFVLLTFAGLLGFKAMKVQNFPDIDLPTVSITAVLPGASPAQMETDVARKIENALSSIQGLKHITTKAQDGVQEAVDDVRSAVAGIRADLPADLRDPVISKLNLAGQPVLAYTIASPSMDDEALSWFVDNEVSRKLLAVKGVGAVTRVGGVNRIVQVALDPQRLQALGVTAADVSRALRQMQLESAGGRADLGGGEQPVRTLATVRSAAEIGRIEIPLSGGGGGRRGHTQTYRSVAERASRSSFHRGAGDRRNGKEFLRCLDGDAARGCAARRDRRLVFPARVARHPDLGARLAAFGHSDLRRHAFLRLFLEPAHLARTRGGDRGAGR